MSVLFWACAVIAFVVAEIMTIQLVSIWFAAGSLVTLLFSYFYELTAIEQLGIFIISSSIFLLISLPLLRNRRNRKNARRPRLIFLLLNSDDKRKKRLPQQALDMTIPIRLPAEKGISVDSINTVSR